MPYSNETSSKAIRFLTDGDFDLLLHTFTEAFSDYVVPFALTETQFRNHINLTAVDLQRTVGCFERDELIGFSLNGLGEWNGLNTVYDAGTGVVPSHRREGVSRAMFEFMIPELWDQGFRQILLEVITTNHAAVRLYESLGFEVTRELTLLQCDRPPAGIDSVPSNLEVKPLEAPDWQVFATFWDGLPSWQNSIASVDSSLHMKSVIGAFLDGRCVGYIIFSTRFGRIAQIAVSKEHRLCGVGTALARAMHENIDSGFSAQVVNLDLALRNAVSLFEKLGYYERLRQYEMVLQI